MVIEQGDSFWLDPKRLYFINNEKSMEARGFHAHKELSQVMIVLSGSFDFLLDDGSLKESIILSKGDAISIKPMVWRQFIPLSQFSVLAVLASDKYNESDYIRDYNEFLNF